MSYNEMSIKLQEFLNLDEDWDGCGAHRISANSIKLAYEILKIIDGNRNFSIEPTCRGTVWFKQRVSYHYMSIEVYDDYFELLVISEIPRCYRHIHKETNLSIIKNYLNAFNSRDCFVPISTQ